MTAAAILLVALAVPAAALAVAILAAIGPPVLLRQPRSGRNGAPFLLLKFRTMTDERDAEGRLLADELRLTRFGRWLRAWSLDELPQLWNVLKGEMSLVGPRPLLPQYLARYDDFQLRRLEVSPGITGWAQVNGRNALAWESRFRHDVWYVDHWSLLLDLRIVARTLALVVRREGVSSPDCATMPEFKGIAAAGASAPASQDSKLTQGQCSDVAKNSI